MALAAANEVKNDCNSLTNAKLTEAGLAEGEGGIR
jgi:hypothetical protein